MTNSRSSLELSRLLETHLQSWGLNRFQDETAYYQWQRSVLSATDLSSLNQLAQYRQNQEDSTADIRFYDLAATPAILPVLYSQRYEFFCTVGVAIAMRLSTAQHVLDFGCGVGILTTFWATIFPDIEFVGIDRSSQSVAVASEQAAQRQLKNVCFKHCQIPRDEVAGVYDCLVSTQALFQAEDDPGLCSADWNTFERSHDESPQVLAEDRTGVAERLNALRRVLTMNGKMLLCEKARHLGRRVFLQRALARLGFRNVREPMALTYDSIGERVEDGPLYEVSREGLEEPSHWDEQPEWNEGQSLYACSGAVADQICTALDILQTSISDTGQQGKVTGCRHVCLGTWRNAVTYGYVATASGFQGMLLGSVRDETVIAQSLGQFSKMTEHEIQESIQRIWGMKETTDSKEPVPWYENHTLAAQTVWQSLPDRSIQEEKTFREPDGRTMHIEHGTTGPLTYVYWANTYDQRQLVMADSLNADWLVGYYRESLVDMQNPSKP